MKPNKIYPHLATKIRFSGAYLVGDFFDMQTERLPDDKVIQVHKMVQEIGSIMDTARYFGITKTMTSMIARGLTYKHLGLPKIVSQQKSEICRHMSIEDRLNKFHIKNHRGCWNWTGKKDRMGYGRCSFEGKKQFTHRISHKVFKGPVPDDLCVLHSCDNPACINPDHLRVGTQEDNAGDMLSRNRASVGERHTASKLNNESVMKIVKLRNDGMTIADIARNFDVASTTVSSVLRGHTWSHLTGIERATIGPKLRGSMCHASKLCDADVIEILRLSESGMGGRDISKLFPISESGVSGILLGKSWKHIPR